MTKNKLMGDERIIDAAMSLAKLVDAHKKPIALDMAKYMEVVIGGQGNDSVLEEPETREQAKEISDKQTKAQEFRKHFVEALSDGLTYIEAASIQECGLVEIGYASDSFSEKLGDEAWVFLVLPLPHLDDVTVLDL